MPNYETVKGNKLHSAVQSNLTAVLEEIDNPRSLVNTDQFIYQSDPRSKEAKFSSYPIIYIEDYSISDEQDPTLDNATFNMELEAEFAIIAADDSAQQKKWHDQISDRIDYKFKYGDAIELRESNIGQVTVQRNQRITGGDRADQPIIRREVVINASMQIDYSKVTV